MLNLVICEDIIRDVESDRVSLINITEQITSISYPVLLPKLAIYILLERENQEIDFLGEIEIINNDKVLVKNQFNISFNERDTTRVLIKINGISIMESGNLNIEVSLGSEIKSSLSVPLLQKTLQEVTDLLKNKEIRVVAKET